MSLTSNATTTISGDATTNPIKAIMTFTTRVAASEPSQPNRVVRLFACGLLFGIGALMKQPALLFVPFGAIYIVWNDLNRRLSVNRMLLQILTFVMGVVVPLGITSLILWCTRVLDKFWFWT
ncbi:MAG: glycosyltransferase family 39 protein, partial [Thermoanaerobaculia bacterium]